jgi:hypothetical protein
MFRHYNAGQDPIMLYRQIIRILVENVKLRYLATVVTNQDYILKEVNRLINWENSSYHLVQKITYVSYLGM